MATRKNSADFIDFHGIVKDYLSKWYLFVISVIICLLVGWLFSRKYHRDTAVRANVLISQDDNNPFGATSEGGGGGGLGMLFGNQANVEDEIFVFSSHSLFRDVAKSLGLDRKHYVRTGFLRDELAYPDFPVDVTADGVADTLGTSLVFKIKVDKSGLADISVKEKKNTLYKKSDVKLPATVKTDYGTYLVSTTPSYPKGEEVKSTIVFSGFETVAEGLMEEVKSDIPSKRGNVISLGYDTPNASYGKDVLNELIVKYNERGIKEKNIQGEQTASFLEDRISLIGNDLDEAEKAIQNYKNENKITDLSTETSYQHGKRVQMEAALFEAELNNEMLKLARDFFADSLTKADPAPLTLAGIDVEPYNNLILERTRLLNNARPDNIALKVLDRNIELSRKNMLKSINASLRQSQLRLNELNAEEIKAKSKLSGVPAKEREYIGMRRHQLMKEHLYTFLLERNEENSILLANSTPKGKIIDYAYTLNTPLGVSNKVIYLIFFIIGLLLPPVGIYLWKIVRNKFENRRELERYVSAPVLGEICVDKSGRKLVVTEKDTSSVTELFRLLKVSLRFMLSDKSERVVLVTSTVSGEGKSFVSSNLAATLSLEEDKKVLLVGMDIRNPQLENYLDIHPAYGLTNYLSSSTVEIDSIINPLPGYRNLDVITAGPIPPNPSELIASKKVRDLFEILRKRYDYIIVDSAPVGMVSDTFTLAEISDMTVYVTRVNYTSITDLRFIESIYEDNRLKKLSVVINGTSAKKGYGYGYGRNHTK